MNGWTVDTLFACHELPSPRLHGLENSVLAPLAVPCVRVALAEKGSCRDPLLKRAFHRLPQAELLAEEQRRVRAGCAPSPVLQLGPELQDTALVAAAAKVKGVYGPRRRTRSRL